ncbi:MAG: biopolymer transporter ExbD [Myxococcota bacterium]
MAAADHGYAAKKRRRKPNHEDPAEEGGELNIVPYLDIIMNLIIFLLVIQAVLVSVGMIDVTAPTYAAVANPDGAGKDDDKKDLNLTLGLAANGFYIAATGGVLPGEAPPAEGDDATTPEDLRQQPPTIPLRADGSHDFKALGRKLRTIKNAFPDTIRVNLAADKNMPYKLIVRTLDVSREDKAGELFPGVVFTKF